MSSDSQPIVSEFFKSTKEIKENTQKPAPAVTDDDDEVNIEGDSLDKTQASTEGEGQTTEDEKETSPEANEFPYLDHLFRFLDSESLNLTSAGYFAKIVNNLLSKRTSEVSVVGGLVWTFDIAHFLYLWKKAWNPSKDDSTYLFKIYRWIPR